LRGLVVSLASHQREDASVTTCGSSVHDFRIHRPLTRALHWAVFVLVLVAAGAIIARSCVESSAERKELLHLHQSVGIAVLGLMLVRLGWRLFARVGALHNLPPETRISALVAHATLYATLFALPILGVLTSNAFGRPVSFLGVFPLPSLIERDRDLGDYLQEWHSGLAWVLLVLVILHVAAALWHHFLRGDGVLRSMTPFSSPAAARRSRS
jgi:cytochrome b561